MYITNYDVNCVIVVVVGQKINSFIQGKNILFNYFMTWLKPRSRESDFCYVKTK